MTKRSVTSVTGYDFDALVRGPEDLTTVSRMVRMGELRAMIESLHTRRHLTMTGRRELLDWIEAD